jgi:hypothetical protein
LDWDAPQILKTVNTGARPPFGPGTIDPDSTPFHIFVRPFVIVRRQLATQWPVWSGSLAENGTKDAHLAPAQ